MKKKKKMKEDSNCDYAFPYSRFVCIEFKTMLYFQQYNTTGVCN